MSREEVIEDLFCHFYAYSEKELGYAVTRNINQRDNVFYFGCEKRNPERIDIVKVTIDPEKENPFCVEVLHSVMTPIYLMLVENQKKAERDSLIVKDMKRFLEHKGFSNIKFQSGMPDFGGGYRLYYFYATPSYDPDFRHLVEVQQTENNSGEPFRFKMLNRSYKITKEEL